MQPEAIAIRLPAIEAGPETLIGTTPIAVFAEQGMLGAELNHAQLPSRQSLLDRQMAGSRYAIDEVVFVIDRSGSMAEAVSSRGYERKLEHSVSLISKLSEGTFAGSHLRLVTLNEKAEEVDLKVNSIHSLRRKAALVLPEGGTRFDRALDLTANIFNETSSLESRKVVFFLTDGVDSRSSRERAEQIATMIRGQNAAVFLVGIGADYDLENIIHLASKFGFAGWAHTPMPGTGNVFGQLVPAFLEQIRTTDHYLEIAASGPIEEFYGLSPAVREAENGVFYVGYQSKGLGICFTNGENVELKLKVKSSQGDSGGVSTTIPILGVDEAAPYWEKLEKAKQEIPPLLVFLSQLKGDLEALKNLGKKYPSLTPYIGNFLDDVNDVDNPESRASVRASTCHFGTQSGVSMVRANEWSFVARGGGENPLIESFGLHSGNLGPLSLDPGSIISPRQPDAKAYEKVEPQAELMLRIGGTEPESYYNLFSVREGEAIRVGRNPKCDIELSSSKTVSGVHFQIRRDATGFYVEDLGSRNGTFLNGDRVTSEILLSKGDVIRAGEVTLTFNT